MSALARRDETDREAWEPRPYERGRAFAAFRMYRDLGPERSLLKVARPIAETSPERSEQGALAQLNAWSAKWGWVEPAAAWDDELDRLDREEARELRRQIKKQTMAGAAAGAEVFAAALERFKGEVVHSPLDAVRGLELVAKLAGLGDTTVWADATGKQVQEVVASLLRGWLAEADEARRPAIVREAEAIVTRVLA